jgi:hypothetical protein
MSETAPRISGPDPDQEPVFQKADSAASEPDRVEIWAGRVGRFLGYILVLLMIGNLAQHFLS